MLILQKSQNSPQNIHEIFKIMKVLTGVKTLMYQKTQKKSRKSIDLFHKVRYNGEQLSKLPNRNHCIKIEI